VRIWVNLHRKLATVTRTSVSYENCLVAHVMTPLAMSNTRVDSVSVV